MGVLNMLNEIIKLRIIYYIHLYYILNTKLIEYKKPVQLDLFRGVNATI